MPGIEADDRAARAKPAGSGIGRLLHRCQLRRGRSRISRSWNCLRCRFRLVSGCRRLNTPEEPATRKSENGQSQDQQRPSQRDSPRSDLRFRTGLRHARNRTRSASLGAGASRGRYRACPCLSSRSRPDGSRESRSETRPVAPLSSRHDQSSASSGRRACGLGSCPYASRSCRSRAAHTTRPAVPGKCFIQDIR